MEGLALIGGEACEERGYPGAMLVEQIVRRCAPLFGEQDSDFPPVVEARAAYDEPIALQAIEEPGDRCARHARPFGKFMRRQPVRLIAQKKQKHELAFGKPQRRKPGSAVPVYRSSERQHLEARAHIADVGAGCALGNLEQGKVFVFEHIYKAAYNMAPYDNQHILCMPGDGPAQQEMGA